MDHKMIRVERRTHTKAKEAAERRGMTLQGYIRYLVDKDTKTTTDEKE